MFYGSGLALGMHSLGLAPLGDPDTTAGPGMFILSTMSWLLQVSGIFVGPAIAWKLNQRRFSASAVFGAAAGFPLTAVALAFAGWLFYAAVSSGGDLEGLDMLLAAAVAGGAMVAAADFVERYLAERHARSERPSHA